MFKGNSFEKVLTLKEKGRKEMAALRVENNCNLGLHFRPEKQEKRIQHFTREGEKEKVV